MCSLKGGSEQKPGSETDAGAEAKRHQLSGDELIDVALDSAVIEMAPESQRPAAVIDRILFPGRYKRIG